MPTIAKTIEIFHYIQEYLLAHDVPPTIRQIGAEFGLRSSASVHGHLKKMEAKGWIGRTREWRSLRVLQPSRRYRQQFVAKEPLPPEERVIRAVQRGYHTREMIGASTRLPEDDVSDLLAVLWDENKLRIVKNGEVKEFHLATVKAEKRKVA